MLNLFLSCSKKNFCFAYMTVTKSTAIFFNHSLELYAGLVLFFSCEEQLNFTAVGHWVSQSVSQSHHTSTCAFATRGFQTLFLSKTVYVLSGEEEDVRSQIGPAYIHTTHPLVSTLTWSAVQIWNSCSLFYKNCKSSCLKELKKRNTSSWSVGRVGFQIHICLNESISTLSTLEVTLLMS